MVITEEVTRELADAAARGRRFYEERLKQRLEAEHMGEFVAVEPNTGRYFLGRTGSEALTIAHEAMPAAKFFLQRIGSDVTHSLGSYGIRRR